MAHCIGMNPPVGPPVGRQARVWTRESQSADLGSLQGTSEAIPAVEPGDRMDLSQEGASTSTPIQKPQRYPVEAHLRKDHIIKVTVFGDLPEDYKEAREVVAKVVGGFAAGVRCVKYIKGRQDNYVGFLNDPDTKTALDLGGADGMMMSRGRTCKVSKLSREDVRIIEAEISKAKATKKTGTEQTPPRAQAKSEGQGSARKHKQPEPDSQEQEQRAPGSPESPDQGRDKHQKRTQLNITASC